jgi:hypothetical protein
MVENKNSIEIAIERCEFAKAFNYMIMLYLDDGEKVQKLSI